MGTFCKVVAVVLFAISALGVFVLPLDFLVKIVFIIFGSVQYLMLFAIGLIIDSQENLEYSVDKIYSTTTRLHGHNNSSSSNNNNNVVIPKAAPVKTSEDGKWICRNCGEHNAKNILMCKNCGKYR